MRLLSRREARAEPWRTGHCCASPPPPPRDPTGWALRSRTTRYPRVFPRGCRRIDPGRAPRKGDCHARSGWAAAARRRPPAAADGSGRQRRSTRPWRARRLGAPRRGPSEERPLGRSGSSTGGRGAVAARLAGASPRARGGGEAAGGGAPWPPRGHPVAAPTPSMRTSARRLPPAWPPGGRRTRGTEQTLNPGAANSSPPPRYPRRVPAGRVGGATPTAAGAVAKPPGACGALPCAQRAPPSPH